MSIWCINPDCQNNDPENLQDQQYCKTCQSPLVFELGESYRIIWSDIGHKDQPWIAQKVFPNGVVVSRVYEATNGTQTSIVKVLYSTDEIYVRLFDREVDVLNKLNKERRKSEQNKRSFPRVPEVPDHIECISGEANLNSKKYPTIRYLVMEKIEGQNLQEWKIPKDNTQVTEEQARQWLKEILIIIDKLHELNIIHRDVHPRNIIKTPENELVLIDFGCVREILEDNEFKRSNNTMLHSSGYTPDEQIQGKPVVQSDFYALGHTFVYLLTGFHPTARELHNTDWKTLTNNISVSFLKLIDWLKEEKIERRPNQTKVILDCINKLEKGQDLETWMNNRSHQPIDEPLAINWLRKLAKILEFKHDDKNLIHGDIHPSNIIIYDDDETLDLLNFGTEIDAESANNDHTFLVNRDGYTPDEQKQGNPEVQSDFYALGHTFVYLLTGFHPTATELQDKDWKTLTNNIEVSKNLGNLIDRLMKPKLKKRPRNANEILKEIEKIQSNRETVQPSDNPENNQQLSRLVCFLLFVVVFFSPALVNILKNPPPTECKVKDGNNNEVGMSEVIENKIKSKLGQSLLSLTTLQEEVENRNCDIYLDGEIINQPQLNSLVEEIEQISVDINSIKTNDPVDNKIYKVEFCLPNNNNENLPWDYLGNQLKDKYNKDDQLKERYTFDLPNPEELKSYPDQPQLSSQEEITTEQGTNPQQEIIIFQKGCEIILRGQVENESDKTAIIDIAKNLEGVKRVNTNHLKVI